MLFQCWLFLRAVLKSKLPQGKMEASFAPWNFVPVTALDLNLWASKHCQLTCFPECPKTNVLHNDVSLCTHNAIFKCIFTFSVPYQTNFRHIFPRICRLHLKVPTWRLYTVTMHRNRHLSNRGICQCRTAAFRRFLSYRAKEAKASFVSYRY